LNFLRTLPKLALGFEVEVEVVVEVEAEVAFVER
jgi:hypothetical protein